MPISSYQYQSSPQPPTPQPPRSPQGQQQYRPLQRSTLSAAPLPPDLAQRALSERAAMAIQDGDTLKPIVQGNLNFLSEG